MNTGRIIKELRKQRHLSAEDIADRLHVNRSTVYRWERGDIEKIPYQVLVPIANILNVSPLDLLGVQPDLTKEQRLLNAFHLLSEEQQEAIILTVESMVK